MHTRPPLPQRTTQDAADAPYTTAAISLYLHSSSLAAPTLHLHSSSRSSLHPPVAPHESRRSCHAPPADSDDPRLHLLSVHPHRHTSTPRELLFVRLLPPDQCVVEDGLVVGQEEEEEALTPQTKASVKYVPIHHRKASCESISVRHSKPPTSPTSSITSKNSAIR